MQVIRENLNWTIPRRAAAPNESANIEVNVLVAEIRR